VADNYETFKTQVLRLTGIDLESYKENQMKRRIDSLIRRNRIRGYSEYVDLIRNNTEKYEEFINYLTINVSEFWRNPEQWEVLENLVIPELLKHDNMKIWSAACSTGDEPYSLVMLLNKYIDLSKINIYATDIDKQVLAKARNGVYDGKSLKGLPTAYVKKYFRDRGNNVYEINDAVKRCVTFKEHDLLKDTYPSGCDLIICRNVLIYFTEEAKNKIYAGFNNALKKDGFLFLGSTEQILNPADFNLTPISSFFYKKR